MTGCPDWRGAIAHRLESAVPEPDGWEEALEHLEGCPACRQRSLELDPTLVFASLRRYPVEPGEVEQVLSAVEVMRRAGRVGRRGDGPWQIAGRVAAALLLPVLGLVLLFQLVMGPSGDSAPLPVEKAARFGELLVPASELPAPPFVEALDQPQARVYQLGQEDLAVVMIVDENLDV